MKKLIIGVLSVFLAVIIFILCKFSLETLPVFTENVPVHLPILMYHSVLQNPQRTGKYVVTPKKLEEDIIYLKNKGYETVSLKQVIKYVYNGEPLPEKPILLTFDDGMYNNKEYVLPILEKHDACAVFAVVGSYTDEYSESNVTNTNYSYLRWCDINEIMETGRVEFASHSYNLHNISAKRYGTAKNKSESSLDFISLFHEDTQKMQSAFSANCLFTPYAYAYPLGNFSIESERVLKKTGFLASFSCIEGINIITQGNPDCLYLLKRYNRDGRISSEKFFQKIK
ncbi:MAG: polysaccharide deacetylase family protein [Clostridia bacterium]|nr:polysaccharide deacetylase family protein [Clostridia bacterium]